MSESIGEESEEIIIEESEMTNEQISDGVNFMEVNINEVNPKGTNLNEVNLNEVNPDMLNIDDINNVVATEEEYTTIHSEAITEQNSDEEVDKKHTARKIVIRPAKNEKDRRERTCKFCQRMFNDKQTLQYHMAAAVCFGVLYTCKRCLKTFKHKSKLNIHQRTTNAKCRPRDSIVIIRRKNKLLAHDINGDEINSEENIEDPLNYF